MIRIDITEAAFRAIGGLSPDAQRDTGAGRYGPAREGMIPVWLDIPVVEALAAAREPGESYSDVILKLAEAQP